jgi:hypothetical protein
MMLSPSTHRMARTHDNMRRLVELCNDNVAEGPAEPQIAEELFCTPLQMCKVIRRTKGTSYQTHVEMD